MSVHRVILAVGMLGLGGCVSSVDPACDRPLISECDVGYARADCGGDVDPTFACSETTGRCLWFASRCVAVGYRAVDCSPENMCCGTRAGGPWPYPDGFTPIGPGVSMLIEEVATYGPLEVGAGREYPVTVDYDPEVGVSAPSVSCDSGMAFLCAGRIMQPPSLTVMGTDVVVLTVVSSGVRSVTLAVVFGREEAMPSRARAYYNVSNDFAAPDATCDSANTPVGVVTGHVVLSAAPSLGAHGEGLLTLPDGTVVRVSF